MITLAQMLRMNEGKFDSNITWSSLNRTERMAAKRLWESFANLSDPWPFPKGKPFNFDPAIVLYLAFMLREALGRSTLGYLTSPIDHRLGRPFLRALTAALEALLADERGQQGALDCLYPIGAEDTPPAPPATETLRAILMLANSRRFEAWARSFWLPLTSAAVADSPAQLRHLFALVDRQRQRHGSATF